MENLKEINGNEIIDYLNSLSDDDHEELFDVSCTPPYIFEEQKIIDDEEYRLTFSAYFNNWGTDQLITDNYIRIFKDGDVIFELEEPFDSDSSSDVLEELLKKWLKVHKFGTDNREKYDALIEESRVKLSNIGYGDVDIINDIIEKLTKAKTFIK